MFRDNFKECNFGKMKLPKLKGHITIKQYYAKSGNLAEVIEQDNIVTNALPDLLASDYISGFDMSKITPFWSRWFGGILMYENAFATSGSPATIDADDYFAPCDSANHLYAHAGDVAPSDVTQDARRGSPNTIERVVRDGYAKLAWEWGSSVGNVPDGHYIRSVALTHKDVGNFGLGGSNTAFASSFDPFDYVQGSNLSSIQNDWGSKLNTMSKYDDANGIGYVIGDGDGYDVYTETQDVTISIQPVSYLKLGLVQTDKPVLSMIRSFTVTTPITFFRQPSYYFDEENKYLWLFTNATARNAFSATTVKYCVVDCENESLVNLGTEQEPVYYKQIVASESCLAPIDWNASGIVYLMARYSNIVKIGNYVFLPTSNSATGDDGRSNVNGLRRIDITNQADQVQISYPSVQNYLKSYMYGNTKDKVFANSGMVINGTDGYVCQSQIPFEETRYPVNLFHTPNKIVSLVSFVGSGAAAQPRYLIANKMVHTTMLNLDTPVQKTNAKNMNVTYELTEVSGNE